MSNDIVYQIICSSDAWSDYPIMTTHSVKHASSVLKKLRETAESNSKLVVSDISDDEILCINDINDDWYATYSIRFYPVTKYGRTNDRVLDILKDINSYEIDKDC